MLEGITAGFILSLTLFPGAVWLTKVGRHGSVGDVIAVGIAFAFSQWLWLFFSVPGLMMMSKHLGFARTGMHAFAAFVLIYMGWKLFRSSRVSSLSIEDALPNRKILMRNAFSRSLAMPMRLPLAMAVLLSTGVFVNNRPSWDVVPSVLIGVTLGVCWWWGQLSFLSAFFAKRVPEWMTLKSLNKIRPFCAVLYFFLAVISLLLIG